MGLDCNADFVLPVHHQTFRLSREPYLEPIERFGGSSLEGAGRIVVRRIGGMVGVGGPGEVERDCSSHDGGHARLWLNLRSRPQRLLSRAIGFRSPIATYRHVWWVHRLRGCASTSTSAEDPAAGLHDLVDLWR